MKRALIIVAKLVGIVALIAAVLAVVLLIGMQHWQGTENVVIHWDEMSIPVAGVFDGGIGTAIIAWLAVTIALVVSAAALVFAFTLTALALGAVAVLLAAPFLISGLVVYLVMRRSARRRDYNTRSGESGGTPPTPSAA